MLHSPVPCCAVVLTETKILEDRGNASNREYIGLTDGVKNSAVVQ